MRQIRNLLSLHMLEGHAGVEEIFRDRTLQLIFIEMTREGEGETYV
jgi:hypothetical protein